MAGLQVDFSYIWQYLCCFPDSAPAVGSFWQGLSRNSWSCKPNRYNSQERMLVVSWEHLHRASCFCAVWYHLSTLYPPWLNDLRRLYVSPSLLVCGLHRSSHFDHNISFDIALCSKYQAWYISKPYSPDSLRGILHFLVSNNRASSAANKSHA